VNKNHSISYLTRSRRKDLFEIVWVARFQGIHSDAERTGRIQGLSQFQGRGRLTRILKNSDPTVARKRLAE